MQISASDSPDAKKRKVRFKCIDLADQVETYRSVVRFGGSGEDRSNREVGKDAGLQGNRAAGLLDGVSRKTENPVGTETPPSFMRVEIILADMKAEGGVAQAEVDVVVDDERRGPVLKERKNPLEKPGPLGAGFLFGSKLDQVGSSVEKLLALRDPLRGGNPAGVEDCVQRGI